MFGKQCLTSHVYSFDQLYSSISICAGVGYFAGNQTLQAVVNSISRRKRASKCHRPLGQWCAIRHKVTALCDNETFLSKCNLVHYVSVTTVVPSSLVTT